MKYTVRGTFVKIISDLQFFAMTDIKIINAGKQIQSQNPARNAA